MNSGIRPTGITSGIERNQASFVGAGISPRLAHVSEDVVDLACHQVLPDRVIEFEVRWIDRAGAARMSLPETSIVPKGSYLTHREVCGIVASAMNSLRGATITIDMSFVDEATTSAFARLVLFRRQLRRQGRDLRLSGLRDRTETLYHLSRLDSVLPRV